MGAHLYIQFKVELSKIMILFLSWTLEVSLLLFYCCEHSHTHYFES